MTPPRIELGPHPSQGYILTTRQWGHPRNHCLRIDFKSMVVDNGVIQSNNLLIF